MIDKPTLAFLKAIKKNNNKEWFDKNKEKYLFAKENVETLIDNVLKEIVSFDKRYSDLSAKKCTYRIYRDVRFSPNKTPYKNNLGASINIGGKKALNAGFYIHIEPGKSILAGGMWMPPGEQLKKIRQEIDYNGKKFHKILNDASFKKYYGTLSQSYALKTTPKGYAKDHPDIDLLRLTSFIVVHSFTDAMVMKKSFAKDLGKGIKIMKPLIDFINTSLD